MKQLLTTAAILVALIGAATAQASLTLDRTQEYRMWSAEQMVKRLTDKMARTTAACTQARMQAYLPKLSEICTQAVVSAYPILTTIREIAADGDPVRWANLLDIIHKVEAEIEAPLNNLERSHGK